MNGKVTGYRREQLDSQINAVEAKSKDGQQAIVVSVEADRKAVSRLRAHRGNVLVLVPGLHLVADMLRRAWAGSPVTTAAAGVAVLAVGVGGVELAAPPAKPPVVAHDHRPFPLDHVRAQPRPEVPGPGWSPRRPSVRPAAQEPTAPPPPQAASQASPSPIRSSPTPTTLPGPVSTAVPSSTAQAEPTSIHRRRRHRIIQVIPAPSATPTVERSDSPIEETPSPVMTTLEASAAAASDIPTP